ncbi:germination protein [Halobacillus andaensis]|uniref:Germination protein n=1 Tax=Halobacillus andaensis TaxID=1176239 RepID=A0A917EX16_HALAA|nr:endospore germination permease [Halobacillus andaensis]MBP2005149.1 spore germination protein KB [Halobacillus andaensis]GGF29220.1 germination protein [Halobacillus andaensis]
MDNQTISPRQFMFLVILFTIGSSIIIVPGPLAAQAKQDAWLSITISLLIGLTLILFYNHMAKLMEGKTFVQATIMVFGNWFGRFILFFYLSFLFILAALVLRNIGDFMTTEIIPETPLQFTHILFLIVVIWGAYLGLEVMGRSAEMFMPWVFLLLLFFTITLAPQINVENLQPFLGEGFMPVLSTSTFVIGTPLLEMVTFLMIFPYVKDAKTKRKAWVLGVFIGGMILTLITLLCLLVLGSDLTALNTFPSYKLAQKINIAGFLEGLEIVIGIIWMLTIFFKMVVLYYAVSVGVAQFLTMDDHRPLLLPLGMGMIVLSIIAYPDVAYFETFVGDTWFPYAFTHGFILPAFVWIGLIIKSKRDKKQKDLSSHS